MNSRQKQASLWLLPAFFGLIIFILLFWFTNPVIGQRLQVSSDGKVIYDVPVTEKRLEVAFNHSVNKGHIREIYIIDTNKSRLALEKAYFENYGAGMLDTVPPDVGFHQEDNYLVLDFPLKYQEQFTYRAGREARHTLAYGKDVLSLYEMVPQKNFTISVKAKKFRELIMKGCGQDCGS